MTAPAQAERIRRMARNDPDVGAIAGRLGLTRAAVQAVLDGGDEVGSEPKFVAGEALHPDDPGHRAVVPDHSTSCRLHLADLLRAHPEHAPKSLIAHMRGRT